MSYKIVIMRTDKGAWVSSSMNVKQTVRSMRACADMLALKGVKLRKIKPPKQEQIL